MDDLSLEVATATAEKIAEEYCPSLVAIDSHMRQIIINCLTIAYFKGANAGWFKFYPLK